MNNELLEFIRHARNKGMDHSTIRILLLSAGWREKDVAKGLAEEGLDLPVPEPPSSGGAKEAFQYLFAFTALGFLVGNVINLFFQYVEVLFRDPAEPLPIPSYTQTGIRWSIAILALAAPLYLVFMRWIARGLQQSPERAKSPIRRWLTYLALFIVAVAMMVDGVALIFGFLTGELTTRFILQVTVVLLISVIVFCYYLLSLRIPEGSGVAALQTLDRVFAGIALIMIALGLGVGFMMVESPATARLRRFDERRVLDLNAIHLAIERRVFDSEGIREKDEKMQHPLPQNLEELDKFVTEVEHRHRLSLFDPQTGKKYGFVVKGPSTYELCAEFAFDNKDSFEYVDSSWKHPAGKYCFEIKLLNEGDVPSLLD